MSGHNDLMYDYRPGVGESLTYPDPGFTMPNVEGWSILDVDGQLGPTDRTLWAESGEDYRTYMKAFIEKHGKFKKPFSRATMMVQPTKWNTGYNDEATKALNALSLKRGEALRITDAIGVVNSSIKRLEQLYHQADRDLNDKKKLRRNSAYVDLAEREAMVELRTLDSDITALEALRLGYGNQLSQLRNDGKVLNQELEAILFDYRETAALLNINDDFESKLNKARGKSGTRGLLVGSTVGVLVTGGVLFLLLQARRSPQRVRSTRRGADGLFFRAA
ncbi:MAG: hypothetical protein CMA57_00605 [Euryarchaeota archaeon]|nr:hypothetical protein [Euryarchaeota archaeon]|tara:strand:- start:8498 stop:9328 length:831 start_codon:yes stop_codon:yes gene_type:complete